MRQADGIIRLGVVGAGRIARRFVRESHYVSGVNVETVWSRTQESAERFAEAFNLSSAKSSFEELLAEVDAVHIATPHESHVPYTRQALEAGVHVLCEKPIALHAAELPELYALADAKGLVLLEALKTAFAPGFQRMIAIARSGTIGSIRSVDATFTKLIRSGREVDSPAGGAITELASYPLLAILKLLGEEPSEVVSRAFKPAGSLVEQFARIDLEYPHAIATAKVGIGVKAEGDLVVAGTRGYLYVPSPWWLTEYFETRFEDPRENRKYYFKYDGDGLRYELAEFAGMIRDGAPESFKLRRHESQTIAELIERARTTPRIFGAEHEEG
ncbi:MAG: Gfo/Idh/MocA family oxidoreductase [Arachnia sp.]